MSLFSRLKPLDRPDLVQAYLYRCMVNRISSSARRQRLWERTAGRLTAAESQANELVGLVDERDQLRRALAVLPPRMRAALVLRHYVGLSEQETADVLHCSVGNVKALVHRARERLQRQLAPTEEL